MSTITIGQTLDNARATIERIPETVKLPLFGPDNAKTPHYGLFRSDNGRCMPISVKRGFEPHTVPDLWALTESAILSFPDPAGASVKVSFTDRGHSIIVAPSADYRRSIFGTNDNIFPRIGISAFFGRTFNFSSGMYRDLCKNLSFPKAIGAVQIVKIRHTASLRDQMDNLIADCKLAVDQFDSIYTLSVKLESMRANVADFMSALYPLPESAGKKAETQATNRARAIYSRLLREQIESGREQSPTDASLWELLNAVTGYVQHDKTRHKSADGQSMGMLDRAIAGVDDPETIAVWDYVASLAS